MKKVFLSLNGICIKLGASVHDCVSHCEFYDGLGTMAL